MATRAKGTFSVFSRASFLFVLTLALIFLYAYSLQDSSIVFPQNSAYWNKILTFYVVSYLAGLIIFALINRQEARRLATANYWKATITRFVPSAGLALLILIPLQYILRGANAVSIWTAIAYVPLPVLLVHFFCSAQVEELLFGGAVFTTIEKKSGRRRAYIANMILFSLWHLAKSGGNIVIMITYAPLRLGFDYLRNNGWPYLNRWIPRYFGPSPNTNQSNAGAHFAWDIFVTGFIAPFRI